MKIWHNVSVNAATRLRQFSWLLLAWFIVLGLGVITAFYQYWRVQTASPALAEETISSHPEVSLHLNATPPAVSAHAVWVYDRNTRSLLYEQNAATATAVASLAKLMTALVAYESFDIEEGVSIGSAAAVEGNRAKFLPSDRFSVGDLLKAMLIFSANDAAEALAQAHPASREGFIARMNERAQAMKLLETHFANNTGLDEPEQFASARDIGRIADTVLEIPFLSDIVSQSTATIREQRTGRQDVVYTTNSLLYKSPKFRGMKTGTTELAGENLVVRVLYDDFASASAALFPEATESAQPKKLDLLMVLLGSQQRFSDALALTSWVEKNLKISYH